MTTMSIALKVALLFLAITTKSTDSTKDAVPVPDDPANSAGDAKPPPQPVPKQSDQQVPPEGSPKTTPVKKDDHWILEPQRPPFKAEWDCKHLGNLCAIYDCNELITKHGGEKLPTERILQTSEDSSKHNTLKAHWQIEGSHGSDQLLCVSYNPTANFLGIVDIGDDQIRLAELTVRDGQTGHDIKIIPPPEEGKQKNLCSEAKTLCDKNVRVCHTERFDAVGHYAYPAMDATAKIFKGYSMELVDAEM